MRKIIEDRLKACVWANLAQFDSKTGECIIPCYQKATYQLNHCYLLKLPAEIINRPDSLLAVNYNHGTCPTTEYYKAYVSKVLGQLIFVDALEFNWETKTDGQTMWSGWLDTKKLTQVAAL